MVEIPPHPAKFSDSILNTISVLARQYDLAEVPDVLDPFVGTGKIYQVFPQAVGLELMPKWAAADKRTRCGNVLNIRGVFRRRRFRLVVTSPCYGNRYSDHHNNQDSCKKCQGTAHEDWWVEVDKNDPNWEWVWFDENSPKCKACKGTGRSLRHSYFHYYGPDGWIAKDNAGQMPWGPKYRDFHIHAWRAIADQMTDEADIILNVSDHYKDFERQPVERFHLDTLANLGFKKIATRRVKTPRHKHGQNYKARVASEGVFLLHRSAA